MENKEMSEKTQKNFFFLFSFPSTPNFLFYFKYDRKLVSVIVRKSKRMGEREKRAVENSPPFPKQKEKKFECINVPAGWRYPEN